jgi:diguanylate cyclase (GGDEF)-like protein
MLDHPARPEQPSADFDQPLSDKYQPREGADQSWSERALERAGADRQASQRDQTAADRDTLHASAEGKFLDACAAIEADHARGMADRRASGEDRAAAAEDRRHAAADRDLAGIERDRAKIDLEKAQLDDLTGFYRLGLGTAVLQHEMDRSRRSGGRMVVAYCDVDGLKQVNDERGHAAGDQLLKGLAGALRSHLRSYDPVVRVGGDEFVCALSETNLEQAGRVFRDVQDALAEELDDASVSVGLAALRPEDDLATLLERSDQALRESRSPGPAAPSNSGTSADRA